uniref:CSON010604 protein n=1 Tax=Culicoides sonorensis TaxID=179676 RepID=A0A336M7B6_CULSO
MDSVLSVLVTTISAMDIIEVLMYFAAHLRGDKLEPPSTEDLEAFKSNIKDTISQTPIPENSHLTCTQDGTLFKDQFRVDTDIDVQKLDEINQRVDELSNLVKNSNNDNNSSVDSNCNIGNGNLSSQNKSERSIDINNNNNNNNIDSSTTCVPDKNSINDDFDDDTAKVQNKNLASNTEDALLASNISASQPFIENASNASQVLIETEKRENESLDSCYESLGQEEATTVDNTRLRPLVREDELRHTIRKRSSVSSTSSHESRLEELQALTSLEQEEQQHIEDYLPIIYPGSPLIGALADSIQTDNEPELETIVEVQSNSPDEQPLDEEITSKRYALDKSPIPNIGIQMSMPWGDVKKDEKAHELFTRAKSSSIEEDEGEQSPEMNESSKKWIETSVIKEEAEAKDDDEPVEEPMITVIREKPLKATIEQRKSVTEKTPEDHQVTEIEQKTNLSTEPEEEPVIIQKRINLIGIQNPDDQKTETNEQSVPDKNATEKDKKHDESSIESPMVRRREKDVNAPKKSGLVTRDSEDYEDSEEASLLHNIKDTKLELDVDSQYLDDPQIREMTDYVKKLTKAKVASIEEDDEEADVTEYYWQPSGGTSQKPNENRRRSLAEALVVPATDENKGKMTNESITQDFALQREAMEYQEVWKVDNLKLDEESVFNKQHFNSPRASGHRHSIAYESTKYAGHRRDSLAEMMIIPKTLRESGESIDHLVAQLENEALEYQQIWGVDVPKLEERRKSVNVAQLERNKVTGRRSSLFSRSGSIAELLILPRTVEEPIDESVLLQLENEALAYQYAWNLNPEEVGQRTKKNRSSSISMGILARKKRARPSISRRRQSLAEAIIVPKQAAEMVVDDPHLLYLLENEANEYKAAFGLRTPELMERFDEVSDDLENEESKPDYNEWFKRFDDQSTAHIETTFTDDEDEEVADLLKSADSGDVKVQNHIFYTFPNAKSPASSLRVDEKPEVKIPSRPTTPADYENYMQKFPDQLSPEIQMDDGRKSPATLETYIEQNRLSPIPHTLRAITPEPSHAPPSMETYLERMRSASPQPQSNPRIEIETTQTQGTQSQTSVPTTPRALTPLRTMEHPPSLETYLQRLRSHSPQAETEY